MADNSGGNALLGLILGGLVVFVAMAYAFGWYPGAKQTAEIKIEIPKIEVPKAN